ESSHRRTGHLPERVVGLLRHCRIPLPPYGNGKLDTPETAKLAMETLEESSNSGQASAWTGNIPQVCRYNWQRQQRLLADESGEMGDDRDAQSHLRKARSGYSLGLTCPESAESPLTDPYEWWCGGAGPRGPVLSRSAVPFS